MHGNNTAPFTSLSVLKPICAKINNMDYNLRTLIYQNKRGKEGLRDLWVEQSLKMKLMSKNKLEFNIRHENLYLIPYFMCRLRHQLEQSLGKVRL